MTMEPEIQRNLEPLHAHEMLKELKTLFAQQAEQELLQTTKDFHSCRQEEGQSVSSYVLKMKGYIDNLERLRHPVTLGLVNELHAMLKLHEQTLPKSNAPSLNAIRAGKVQKVFSRVNEEEKNTASEASGSGIFVIELNTILNRSWIYDTGSGTHICNTTHGLRASRKLKPGALSFNKRVKLDFDSTLLWHCRLGHISKKCIEKLQHDRLLNSFVLTAFEKCVSCMSGKIARKPYTHQVERAKDLLRLIHTDVCGPFKIMSRQGASYFVTFTDDFSRYGYVYLLKHKHEVSETFKVFQKEVENQLGKVVLLLCIFGPPGPVLVVQVWISMSQSTLPKSFWDYALKTAVRILNMVPTKKVEKTQYEVWHVKVPKLYYLKV
nr:hypothetical protein [Tanacetum cinerariifolium]